jgi:hypothetical protein
VGFISRDSLVKVVRKCRQHPNVTGKTKFFFSSDVDSQEPYVDLSPHLDKSPIQVCQTRCHTLPCTALEVRRAQTCRSSKQTS